MNSIRWRRILTPLFLCLLLFVTACQPNPPSRYSQVQKETSRRGAPAAVSKVAERGSTFNEFFPKKVKGYDIVPAQEKKGFAEYKVNKDGKNVAMISISDTTSLPSAAVKYQSATSKIAGYPAVDQGANATGILVNGYQVKVLSRDPAFTRDDRVAWLQKVNLKGIAKLKPALAPTASKPVTAPSVTTKTPTYPQRTTPVLTPQPAG